MTPAGLSPTTFLAVAAVWTASAATATVGAVLPAVPDGGALAAFAVFVALSLAVGLQSINTLSPVDAESD